MRLLFFIKMPSLRIHKENEDLIHFITITTIEWIDIFTKREYFDVLINCLKFCQESLGLFLYEYVIMTNHIHLIGAVKKGFELSKIISSFKSFSSKEIIKLLKQDKRNYIIKMLQEYPGLRDGTRSQQQEGGNPGQQKENIKQSQQQISNKKNNYRQNKLQKSKKSQEVSSDFHVGAGSFFDLMSYTEYKKKILYQKYSKNDFKGTIWQRENWPEVIETERFLDQKINYIYNNPVKKGYVSRSEDWLYSSARNRILKDNSIICLEDWE